MTHFPLTQSVSVNHLMERKAHCHHTLQSNPSLSQSWPFPMPFFMALPDNPSYGHHAHTPHYAYPFHPWYCPSHLPLRNVRLEGTTHAFLSTPFAQASVVPLSAMTHSLIDPAAPPQPYRMFPESPYGATENCVQKWTICSHKQEYGKARPEKPQQEEGGSATLLGVDSSLRRGE